MPRQSINPSIAPQKKHAVGFLRAQRKKPQRCKDMLQRERTEKAGRPTNKRLNTGQLDEDTRQMDNGR